MMLKDLFKKIFKKDNISEKKQTQDFKEGFTTDIDNVNKTLDKDGLEIIKEQAKKEIFNSFKNAKSTYTEKGFKRIEDRVVDGIRIADEFLIMEKNNIKFVILDGIYSCSKNTSTIEGICLECAYFDDCIYLKEI